MARVISVFCALVGAVFIALACYAAIRAHNVRDFVVATPAEDGPRVVGASGIIVEDNEQTLGVLPVGKHNVSFTVANHTAETGTIVGYPASCGTSCCWVPSSQNRIDVSAGESVQVPGVLDVRSTGAFEFKGILYINERGTLKAEKVLLTGFGVATAR